MEEKKRSTHWWSAVVLFLASILFVSICCSFSVNISLEYPFLYFNSFGIKLSLISLAIYSLISGVFCVCGKKKNEFIYIIKCDTAKGKRNQIVIGVLAYASAK